MATHAPTHAPALRRIVQRFGARRILVVCGRDSFRSCGAEALLQSALFDVDLEVFSGFAPNPTVEVVEQGVAALRSFGAELVVVVGGGSVLDVGKLLAFFAESSVAPRDWLRGARSPGHRGYPVIAIPTTGGSGAEVTQFAVMYEDGRKYSVEDERIRPARVLLVPDLLASMSPYLLRRSGLDALVHGVESFWSVAATPESQADARAAILGIYEQLDRAASGQSVSFSELAHWSNLAGMAIARTRTTACHAISYPLTGRFGIPHGHAVALTLPAVLAFIASCDADTAASGLTATEVQARAWEVASLLRCAAPEEAKARLEALLDQLGIERRLSALGCGTPEAREVIVSEGLSPSRAGNLPRQLGPEALREMLVGLV